MTGTLSFGDQIIGKPEGLHLSVGGSIAGGGAAFLAKRITTFRHKDFESAAVIEQPESRMLVEQALEGHPKNAVG